MSPAMGASEQPPLPPSQPQPEQNTPPAAATGSTAAAAEDRSETVELLRARIADLARSEAAPAATSRSARGRERSAEPAQNDAGAARAVCLRLLTGSARTRVDLERALTRRGFDPAVTAGVLDRLTEVGLIDDRAYAEAFVRGRHEARALARPALDRKLRERGIDPEVAAGAVAQLDDGAEAARAEEFVRKRLGAALTAGPDAARRRLLGQLARRGYSGDLAFRIVEAALVGTPTRVPLPD
jgi:regulatory protein